MGVKSEKTNSFDGTERAAEILVEILDHCGVWAKKDGEDPPSWVTLGTSLTKLADMLQKLEWKWSVPDSDDQRADEIMLDVEEEVQNVKRYSTQVKLEIDDISDALSLCHEMEEMARDDANFPLSCLSIAISMSHAIRKQRTEMFHSLRKIDATIDTMYDFIQDKPSNAGHSFTSLLRQVSNNLHKKCINTKSKIWEDARDFVGTTLSPAAALSPAADVLPERANSSPSMNDFLDPGQAHSDILMNTSHSARFHQGTGSTNVLAAAKSFAMAEPRSQYERSILLVGQEGFGKTHNLNRIQYELGSLPIRVIRPSLPFDAMGRMVGSAEDLMLSMISCTMHEKEKCVLLLDDIESVIGDGFEEAFSSTPTVGSTAGKKGSVEHHLAARYRILFLSLLELVRYNSSGSTMIICTSRTNFGKTVDRFDRVFVLDYPSKVERRYFLDEKLTALFPDWLASDNEEREKMLTRVVECTTGLSYAELTFQSRSAALESSRNDHSWMGFLMAVMSQLQERVPDSLKMGTMIGNVDLRVLTFQDLQDDLLSGSQSSGDSKTFSLHGSSIEHALEVLQRLIISPICNSIALNKLMFDDGSAGGKIFAGGILLTGAPGNGKTALAYHCAAIAASRNSSVKLLDVSCTSLIHKEVGSSEQAVHNLFVAARAATPCILLLDGIENIAAVRGNDNTTEGTMDRVLSTLLTELDGVDADGFSVDNSSCLAIIGITHNAEWVDPALRRPGRLERTIEIDFPEEMARRKIIERELSGICFSRFASIDELATFVARHTEGFSGAAMVGVCNDAKLRASKSALREPNDVDKEAGAPSIKYSIGVDDIRDAIDSQRAGIKTGL